jgi:hypothetical protein
LDKIKRQMWERFNEAKEEIKNYSALTILITIARYIRNNLFMILVLNNRKTSG